MQEGALSNPTVSHPPWKKKLPMWLTWGRILSSIPIVILLYATEFFFEGKAADATINSNTLAVVCEIFAALLFIAASITDWFDGALARKYNVVSPMGQFLDPVADKILVFSILIMLVHAGTVNVILVVLLLARETFIAGIRSVAATEKLIIAAGSAGKWKTGFQMVGIPMILMRTLIPPIPLLWLGNALLWISLVLSLISGTQYTMAFLQSRKD